MPQKCKNAQFPHPSGILNSVESAITVYYDPDRFLHARIAKTPAYPVMYRFPHFVGLCDHNPSTLRTDGRTDGRTDVMLVA